MIPRFYPACFLFTDLRFHHFLLPAFLIAAILLSTPAGIVQAGPNTGMAEADSVMLAEFLAQPKDVREQLAKEARDAVKKAEEVTSGPRRLALLQEATRSDPTNPSGWLALSETYAMMGYGDEASSSLSVALRIIKGLKGKEKKERSLEYSLARAWQEYEKADFREGEKWGEMAVKLDGGQKAHLIALLNAAALTSSEAEITEALGVFRPFDTNTNRLRNAMWVMKIWMHLNNIDWVPPDIWGYKEATVKYAERETERSRDLGMLFEVNGEGNLAAREYAKFLKFHPLSDGGWLQKLEGPTPGSNPGFPVMPFWINDDGGYVAGSRLAHLVHCYDRMQTAISPEERGVWATHIVRSGVAAMPRYPRRPWIRMWRGAAFLALDMQKDAEEEFTMARAWFEEFGIDEPQLNPLQGHLLLAEKSYTAALPMLEQAALDFPEDASVWGDLGVARAMKVGLPPAREAFDRALDLDPRQGPTWHNRGMLNLRDGNYEGAAADLEKAAEFMPENEEVLNDLARVQQKLRLINR